MNIDLTQYVLAATTIIGLVNGIQMAVNRDWKSFAFFMTALIAGAVFGALNWFGLPSIEVGFALGVGSSGLYKISQNI